MWTGGSPTFVPTRQQTEAGLDADDRQYRRTSATFLTSWFEAMASLRHVRQTIGWQTVIDAKPDERRRGMAHQDLGRRRPDRRRHRQQMVVAEGTAAGQATLTLERENDHRYELVLASVQSLRREG